MIPPLSEKERMARLLDAVARGERIVVLRLKDPPPGTRYGCPVACA